MSLRHVDDWLTIHGGDCRDVLAGLPAESVHCVVTSPPYWGLRDYGVAGQLGLEATPDEYVANMVAVFREVRRVLRADGTLWLNLGDSYASSPTGTLGDKITLGGGQANQAANLSRPSKLVSGLKPKDLVGIPWRVAFALQADGWYLRSDVIWSKPNPMPESVTDRPTKAHEYLFLLSKSPRYWYDADAVRETAEGARGGAPRKIHEDGAQGRHGATSALNEPWTGTIARNRRSVWTVATQPYPGAHFAVMPEALVEPCVLAGCPDKACSVCGAPWERVVERGAGDAGGGKCVCGITHGKVRKVGSQDVRADYADETGGRQFCKVTTTTGWKPSCDHDAPTVPGTVLDPFGGSGTVARVANRLSRRAVLIDLNPEYLEQQMKRNRDMPLGLTA